MAGYKFNKRFQNLCPKLTDEERKLLEESIIESGGCRDPICVWGEYVVDGHNRYDICRKRGFSFPVKKLHFKGEAEAEAWIIKNQLGRRNLTPEQRTYLIGKRMELEKKPVGRPAGDKLPQNEGVSTADKIAAEEGVSRATVERAAEFSGAVDTLSSPVAEAIKSGEVKATAAEVKALAELPKSEQKAAVKAVESGKAKSIKAALAPKPKSKPGRETDKAAQALFVKAFKLVGQVTRMLDKIAEQRGGQGDKHTACLDGMNEFIADLKNYQKGGK